MNTLKDKLSSDTPTTNIFVLEFDIHTLQGVLEVNDLTVSFTVASLQELKEEYGAVKIGQVINLFLRCITNTLKFMHLTLMRLIIMKHSDFSIGCAVVRRWNKKSLLYYR